MGELYLFQTHVRRAIENPSPYLRDVRWLERHLSYLEYVETGQILRFPSKLSQESAKKLVRQNRRLKTLPVDVAVVRAQQEVEERGSSKSLLPRVSYAPESG